MDEHELLKGSGVEVVKKYIGFVGTYTRESSEGLYRFELDTEAGTIGNVQVAAKIGSPTYVNFSEDEAFLYAIDQEGDQGGVAAFKVDRETGELSYLNNHLEDGVPPCHLSVNGNELVAGNYHKGVVDLFKVNDQGIEEKSFSITHEGTGPHERQESPHVHYTAHTPDGKFVVVVDLGTDELVTYKVEEDELVRVGAYSAKPGSGPRHLDFHPNGQTAYLLTELSSDVIVLDYNGETGEFTEKQVISAVPSDFTGTTDASAIHVSSDGKFVYAGNRGHDSIAVFEIDETDQSLSLIQHISTGGEFPRDFVLDPSETFLVAANQFTGNLVLFSRDQSTGKLTQLNSEINVPEAVCVKFLS